MKLVMTLLVRDEQDLLRENLEFHLAHGVDAFVLMDNLSVDGTAEIAREYERAGRLTYIFQPQDDYSQSRWVTAMARFAREELGADWVINNDADEFWWPHCGSLKEALGSMGGDDLAARAERVNFVARTENDEPFWRRMSVRYAASFDVLGRPLGGKVAHRGRSDIVVEQGNHHVSIGGFAITSIAAAITILHFPVRTRAQFMNKIAKGGAAYERNTDLDPGIGITWRYLYRLYRDGLFDAAFAKELLLDDEVAEGLASGELIRDERLIDSLVRLQSNSVA